MGGKPSLPLAAGLGKPRSVTSLTSSATGYLTKSSILMLFSIISHPFGGIMICGTSRHRSSPEHLVPSQGPQYGRRHEYHYLCFFVSSSCVFDILYFDIRYNRMNWRCQVLWEPSHLVRSQMLTLDNKFPLLGLSHEFIFIYDLKISLTHTTTWQASFSWVVHAGRQWRDVGHIGLRNHLPRCRLSLAERQNRTLEEVVPCHEIDTRWLTKKWIWR